MPSHLMCDGYLNSVSRVQRGSKVAIPYRAPIIEPTAVR